MDSQNHFEYLIHTARESESTETKKQCDEFSIKVCLMFAEPINLSLFSFVIRFGYSHSFLHIRVSIRAVFSNFIETIFSMVELL